MRSGSASATLEGLPTRAASKYAWKKPTGTVVLEKALSSSMICAPLPREAESVP